MGDLKHRGNTALEAILNQESHKLAVMLASCRCYCKFNGLKQDNSVILYFWSGIQNQTHRLKVKVSSGLVTSAGPGENLFPCLFQVPEAAYIP